MNELTFTKASNGEESCTANGTLLHSSYNPGREAERFAKTVSCEFIPKYILVTGPCLSYCAPFLKSAYPQAKVCALQYTKDFAKKDGLWDKVFYADEKEVSLCDQLFNYMGDEGIVSCFFVSWQPSEKAFPLEYKTAWDEIKKAVVKSRNVLATRSYFSKRWAKNALRFCLFAKKTAYIQKGSLPVVVCASGLSLKDMMPALKKNRKSFFLLAVSSALLPLLNNQIVPDLVVTTDGGYWAKKHLIPLLKNNQIPLALSLEASSYAKSLEESPLIPLSYGDGIAEELISASSYQTTRAFRNGTVSGTAASLALDITSGPVFFCGLDLANSKGFSHTQPNELENTDSFFDNRLAPKETRITPRTFFSLPLDTYRAWFSSTDFKGRLFRLSNNFSYQNKLGRIKDVDIIFFENTLHSQTNAIPIQIFSKTIEFSKKERACVLEKTIRENLGNPEWCKNAVPTDAILWERSAGKPNEEKYRQAVEKGMYEFGSKLISTLERRIKE